MQKLDWDDLRFVLALQRTGHYRLAAKALNVNESTVVRRIGRLQAKLRANLFEKVGGRLVATSAGEEFVRHALHIETQIDAACRAAQGLDELIEGKVCLTAVPIVLRHLLIPNMPELLRSHPRLQLQLVADPRNLSILEREADIALRMARPQEEHGVIATRVALLQYAIYAPAGVRDRRLPWIVYDQGSAGLPHARWIASALRRDPSSSIAVAVNDSDLALQAVRSGLGRTLLPTRIGDAVDGIVRSGNLTPVLRRELWLLVHPALKNVARVRAVIDWIKRTI